MSDSARPHRQKPTRLPRPWDSLGKNTEVGCHFLLQCMKVKSESEVAQLCLGLSHPMDCSVPGSSTHGIFQARVLEWGAISFSAFWLWRRPIYYLVFWIDIKIVLVNLFHNFVLVTYHVPNFLLGNVESTQQQTNNKIKVHIFLPL